MDKNNVAIAEAYYVAMGEKNIVDIEKYLHSDVQFTSPFMQIRGKEAFLETVKKFITLFKTLTIREKFGTEDQAMLVYDVNFSTPVGNLPTAALLTFHEGLIAKIELFFDSRPFDKK